DWATEPLVLDPQRNWSERSETASAGHRIFFIDAESDEASSRIVAQDLGPKAFPLPPATRRNPAAGRSATNHSNPGSVTMKIPLLCGLVGLAISFALPAFAQQKDTADPQIAEQIRMLAVKFDEAFNKHDPAAIAELYTEDGVNVFNGTAHGRQAIEKSYAQDFQSWQSNNHFTKIDRLIAVGNEVR